jgi:hypothetical protein
MINLRTDVLNVPSAEADIVVLREANAVPRTFAFRNLSASPLTLKIKRSTDGGVTWDLVDDAIILAAVGTAGDKQVRFVDDANILKVVGSGGGTGINIELALTSVHTSATNWVSPTI